MICMKDLGISSVLILLIISTFSMVLQVGAQSTDTNLEELLKLAKEKLQQIKSDYTNSNITLNQFSKHLSNITLSQEQVTEIEKDRSALFVACIDRITIQKEQSGGLCDAFADI